MSTESNKTRKILNFIRKRWNTIDEKSPFLFTTMMESGQTIEAFCVDLVVTNRGQIKNRAS
jgi:hypothetical protein